MAGMKGAGQTAPFAFPHDMKAISTPDYPGKHYGPVLVIGSAWNAKEDVAGAKQFYPKAPCCGINRTVAHFECKFMVSVDRPQAEAWKESSLSNVELHGGRFGAKGGPEAYPWFDYWWPELQSGGTSVWLACKIMAAIGFAPIIVCGAPLERGPYLDGDDDWSHRNDDELKAYREAWRRETYMHPIVRSMSGWTRELLGCAT